MKPRALIAIVVLMIVCAVSGFGSAPQAARPRGHPPPVTTLADDAPTLDEILARYVQATGGEEAIAGIDSWVLEARIVTNLPTWDPPSTRSTP